MENKIPLKLLVFGIDGASYNVFCRMMEEDKLPNFQKLRKRSSFGALQSTFPPHTAPGWPSMFSGVEPGEHGIYQFWSTKVKDYQPVSMNASSSTREPTWHSLERHGFKVGVYNVPMTHPPADIEGGYMISWPLSRTLRYTSPPGLMRELMAEGLHYHSDIVTMYRGQEDYAEQATHFVKGRADTCTYLQSTRPVDAMFVVFTEVDRVSHYYWGKEEKPATPVEQSYQEMDDALGTLMELTDENTLIIVASDHGFGLCEADFNVHELLEQHGLLKTKFIPIDENTETAHDDASLNPWFECTFKYKRMIDWDRTYFYMPTPNCFGINANLKGRENKGCLAPEDLITKRKELEEIINNVRDEKGNKLFKLVDSCEIYRGTSVESAPDFIMVPSTFNVMPSPNLTGKLWTEASQPGVHRPDGAVFIAGSTFPENDSILARIEDIHPLILAHMGVPVPEEMDGHWLVEPECEVKTEAHIRNTRGRSLNEEESKFLNIQLKQIGYL